MDLIAVLEQLQSDFIEQYEVAFHQENNKQEELFPEIALEISGGVYKNLYVVDLMSRNNGASDVIEVAPTQQAYGGNINAAYGEMQIRIGNTSWDGMEMSLHPAPRSLLGFERWFDHWLDINGLRQSKHDIFSEVIHSATITDGTVSIDFGSAPVASFLELLSVFQQNGVQEVTIMSSRK